MSHSHSRAACNLTIIILFLCVIHSEFGTATLHKNYEIKYLTMASSTLGLTLNWAPFPLVKEVLTEESMFVKISTKVQVGGQGNNIQWEKRTAKIRKIDHLSKELMLNSMIEFEDACAAAIPCLDFESHTNNRNPKNHREDSLCIYVHGAVEKNISHDGAALPPFSAIQANLFVFQRRSSGSMRPYSEQDNTQRNNVDSLHILLLLLSARKPTFSLEVVETPDCGRRRSSGSKQNNNNNNSSNKEEGPLC
jgi:hypothetical protein